MASSTENENQVQTAVECDTCEKTAKYLCKICHDRLCDSCKIIHSKSKATFDHEVVSLTYEALTLTSESPSNQVCKWHPKFRATVGCQKCEVPVCEKCLIGEHNGHKLMDINEFFQYKKSKLEQKLLTIRTEFPKYELRLHEVKKKQEEIEVNREDIKKEIVGHFEKISLSLDESKQTLLNHADKVAMANMTRLANQESYLHTYIQNMEEFMNNIQNEDLREKISFIYYAICAVDVTIPEICPSLSDPGTLKFRQGDFANRHKRALLGRVSKNIESINLLEKEMVQTVRNITFGKGSILTLVNCSKSGAFWAYTSDANTFRKYDGTGNCVEKINVESSNMRNKAICLVDDSDFLIFRNNHSTLFRYQSSECKLFVDNTPMLVCCLCATSDGEILVGMLHSIKPSFVVARYSLTGECKQYITNIMKKMTPEQFPLGNSFRVYMAENINGDICLSLASDTTQTVIVMEPNGNLKCQYRGLGSSLSQPFLPRGICTDVLGHILIADENNRQIHVLNKDGILLRMLTIPGQQDTVPISLCVDNEDNLCVGCADGKVRIIKYLD